ncbi:MAG: 6-bladed beta-propeller [Tannerella sp.]|nr:6-bladed beta-propeller [Tannerella sp.]
MKTPFFLLFLAIVSCVHQGQKYGAADGVEAADGLSAISAEIVAVPLETNECCRVGEVRQVQCDGQALFVRSENGIYRFDRTGKFRNRLPIQAGRHISDFALNVDRKQVMVLDSEQQLHCFTYGGQALFRLDPGKDAPWQTILDMACYKGSLWIAVERLMPDSHFEKRLVRMDLSGQAEEEYRLTEVDLGRFALCGSYSLELSVAGNSVYAYAPFSSKETVLRDTLHLLASHRLPPAGEPGTSLVMPVRTSGRFLIASYGENVSEGENYLFLYDRAKAKTYPLHGFRDDFYQTGLVKNLQPLDMYGHEYCYCKSGKEVAGAFPERNETANPVLFLLKLMA